jgi:CRP-like cAMP-binding protein
MPWEKATVPDRTTSAGNGADSVADTPGSKILSEVALFRGLPAEQLSKIEAHLRRRTLPAGANVITAEDPGETVYVVLEGSVKVYVSRPDGTEVILAILGAGEIVGEMSLADSLGRSANVTTSLPLTQSDLAALVGASRVRVNQAIAFFKKRRYLSVGTDHRITVLDADALARPAR